MALAMIPRVGQDITFFARETLTVDNTAGGVGFTVATIVPTTTATTNVNPAGVAHLTLETAQIRYTLDGTAPTTTVGHLMNAGDILLIEGIANVAAFKAIRTGGTNGSLQCSFGRFK